MKLTIKKGLGVLTVFLAVGLGGTTCLHAESSTNPAIPVGYLDTFPHKVQPGTNPSLDWNITYPETVRDVVVIEDDGTVIPKENLYMDVRVLGASVQTSATNWLTVEAYAKADGATSFTRFFSGKQPDVNPTRIYYTKYVRQDRTVDFRGRCYYNGWYPYYSTGTNTYNVVVLANGETPPETIPAYNQDAIEDFLKPYLDSNGKIKIGPRDVIILMELAMTHPSQSAFDLQDLVLLVTFRKN